jgi:hypothetical protein
MLDDCCATCGSDEKQRREAWCASKVNPPSFTNSAILLMRLGRMYYLQEISPRFSLRWFHFAPTVTPPHRHGEITFYTTVITLTWEPWGGCNKGLDRQARRMINRDGYDNEHNQTKYCIQEMYTTREISCCLHKRATNNCHYIHGNVSFVICFQRVFIVNESASRIVNPRHQTCRFAPDCFYCGFPSIA